MFSKTHANSKIQARRTIGLGEESAMNSRGRRMRPTDRFQILGALALIVAVAIPYCFVVSCSEITKAIDEFYRQIGTGFWFGQLPVDEEKTDEDSIDIGIAFQAFTGFEAVDVEWTPPDGSTGHRFLALPPSDTDGEPPFEFSSVPTESGQPDAPVLSMSYVPPAVGGDHTFVDTIIATAPDGTIEAFSLSHAVGASVSAEASLDHLLRSKAAMVGPAWRFNHWLYLPGGGEELALADAQEVMDYLQSGDFFIGVRFPVPTEADVLPYRLPVAMPPNDLPVIAIVDHDLPWQDDDRSQSVGDVTLEYLPERNEWLENTMPDVPATRWAALAPSGDEVAFMEERFPLDAGVWEFYVTGIVELMDQPAGCDGCVLEIFACHEGSEPPPVFDTLLSLGWAKTAGVQTDGVTCVGPWAERLVDSWSGSPADFDPPFAFSGQGVRRVQPPETVQFRHLLQTDGSQTMSFRVETTGSGTWTLYEGDFDGPDLGRPVTGNLTVTGFDEVWLVGDIPGDAPSGPEQVTVYAGRASAPAAELWVTNVVWVGEWVPPEGGDESMDYWIPVASHAEGAQGSSWRTDLGLLNEGTVAVDATITLHAAQGPVTMTRTVPPGAQLILADVVDQMGFSGSGALQVTASGALTVTSRTFSQVGAVADCYPGGTLGQSLGASEVADGLGLGEQAVIPQLQENAAYRTNVAVINTGVAPATVRVFLADGAGAELASYDVTLAPGEWKQENQPFKRKAGQTDMAAGFVRVEVLSGSGVTAYGSVVDNITNDPTTQSMVRLAAAAAASWIPVASHAEGAQGSAWRTDLGLLNTSGTAIAAVVTLHMGSGPVVLNVTVPAGAQVILPDVVDAMGVSGSGALEITADGALVVTSRTYSQVGGGADCYPGGTLGQSLRATSGGLGMGVGQAAVIPQLQENAAYRSNVAVINTGAGPASVRVHLFDGAGQELATYDVALDAGEWKQENQPFKRKAGQSDMAAGFVRIEVLAGSGVIAYGSVVDNTTNDPTTMEMIR
jgi:hypothetical protein